MEKIGHLFELSLDKTQKVLFLTEKFWNSTGVPCHFSEKIGKSDKKRMKNFGNRVQISDFEIQDFQILESNNFGISDLADIPGLPIGSPGFSYRVPGTLKS